MQASVQAPVACNGWHVQAQFVHWLFSLAKRARSWTAFEADDGMLWELR